MAANAGSATSAWRSAERFRLAGPSARLDPRVHAFRRDIADIGLADRVFAPHYVRPDDYRCTAASAMLHDRPDSGARAVSQLLHGDAFAVIDIGRGWAWGYGRHDDYVGYVRYDALGKDGEPSHVAAVPMALVFASPDIKSPVVARWPLGARFQATAEDGFLRCAEGYVHSRHARPVEQVEADPVAVAQRLIGAPYLWGGRGDGGIDCSGLVQVALALCGIAAPRDSDQQRTLGTEIAEGAALRRGDLIFMPGHVGMMIDDKRLIHANAHWMMVKVEPLGDVVARAAESLPQPIIARRRLSA